jgi:hypothetical protein
MHIKTGFVQKLIQLASVWEEVVRLARTFEDESQS